MLARCGAAGCILAAFATFLLAPVAIWGEADDGLRVAALSALLFLSAAAFLAGEGVLVTRNRQKRRPAAATTAEPVASADDLVGMLEGALKLAGPSPAVERLVPVNVADLLEDLAKRQDRTRLTLHLRPRPLHTLTSGPALARAFEILVENALCNGSRASVSCDRGTSAIVVHVDDDGPGIPRAERARVLEWHYYMRTPPSLQTGCRAELVIARQIARAHGGDIVVGCSPLGGARLTVRLPLLGDDTPELAAAS